MKKVTLSLILILVLTFSISGVVFAMDITSITADDFYVEQPEVNHGSADGGTLSDAFRETKKQNNENMDTKVMDEASDKIYSLTGTITSAIIYLIFAFTAFTTACDLLYIGVPFLRPYLYDGGMGKDLTGQANANLIGRNMGWTANAMNNVNNANRHGANAQMYQQQAQQRAMMGDMAGARRSMHMANNEGHMANRQMQWANYNMNEQAKSDAWRAEHNQQAMQNAQRRANNNANRG